MDVMLGFRSGVIVDIPDPSQVSVKDAMLGFRSCFVDIQCSTPPPASSLGVAKKPEIDIQYPETSPVLPKPFRTATAAITSHPAPRWGLA